MPKGRVFAPLAAAVLLLGIADSMVGSYLVLFGVTEAGMSPIQVGVFSSAPAVGGLLVSWLVGRAFDRRPTRAYAVTVMALGGLGLALMTLTRSYPLLIACAAVLLGSQLAAFPQLFAMARLVLGEGAAGHRSAPLLRSAWSLAWAIGPLIAAAVLTATGFTTILALAAAILTAASLLVLVGVPRPRPAPAAAAEARSERPAGNTRGVVLSTVSVALFFTAMYAGSVVLPLFVTRGLGQSDSAVGVLYSVCAAVEVVVALVLVAVPARVSQAALILGGMAAFVLYFAVTVLASGMALLAVGQVARGAAIAVVGAAGIRYFQDLLAPATGRATTLFANASTTGGLVAGVLGGTAVAAVGYTGTLLLCTGTAAAAAAAFALGARTRARVDIPMGHP